MRLLRNALYLCVLAAICVYLTACNGESNTTDTTVRGAIVDVADRNLAEIETLRIRDGDGRLWTFTTAGPLEKNGAHLRLHQVLGQTIEVRYEERAGSLVATGLRD